MAAGSCTAARGTRRRAAVATRARAPRSRRGRRSPPARRARPRARRSQVPTGRSRAASCSARPARTRTARRRRARSPAAAAGSFASGCETAASTWASSSLRELAAGGGAGGARGGLRFARERGFVRIEHRRALAAAHVPVARGELIGVHAERRPACWAARDHSHRRTPSSATQPSSLVERAHREPRRVSARHRRGLGREDSRERDAATGAAMRREERRERAQRLREDVGHDEIGREIEGYRRIDEARRHPVAGGVCSGRRDRVGIDIHAERDARAELHGGDGQYTRTAAVIEHAHAAVDAALEPAQARAGGRMAAGAERETGIEADVDRLRVRCVVPRRHDPQRGPRSGSARTAPGRGAPSPRRRPARRA